MSTRRQRPLRLATIGLVLAVAAFVVPNSAVKPTEVALVKVDRAGGVDLESRTSCGSWPSARTPAPART